MALAGERPLDEISGERLHPAHTQMFEISQHIARMGKALEERDVDKLRSAVQYLNSRYSDLTHSCHSREQELYTQIDRQRQGLLRIAGDASLLPSSRFEAANEADGFDNFRGIYNARKDLGQTKILLARKTLLLEIAERASNWVKANVDEYEIRKKRLEDNTACGNLYALEEDLIAWPFARTDKSVSEAEKVLPSLRIAYEYLLHEAATKMYTRVARAVENSPLPRDNPDWIRLDQAVKDHDTAITSMRNALKNLDIGLLRTAVAMIQYDTTKQEFEDARKTKAEWEAVYAQERPAIQAALDDRHIKELDAALQQLPYIDDFVRSSKAQLSEWKFERTGLLADIQHALEFVDGPRLKALLGPTGWTFADEESVVIEARATFDRYNDMKLHLRGLMSKKKILAMDKFLDEWPFTKDDPDIVGATTLLGGLKAQVDRIPVTSDGRILKQVWTGLGGAWKDTDAPRVLELKSTVEMYDKLMEDGQRLIKISGGRATAAQEQNVREFMDKYPFAKTDPIIQDMENFMVGCDRRRDRIKEQVRIAWQEHKNLPQLTAELLLLQEAGGSYPEAEEVEVAWTQLLKDREHVIQSAQDIERLTNALDEFEFSAPLVDQARERLRILVDIETKKEEAKLKRNNPDEIDYGEVDIGDF
jgi:hypothetical protein